jgi:hypothetical protein
VQYTELYLLLATRLGCYAWPWGSCEPCHFPAAAAAAGCSPEINDGTGGHTITMAILDTGMEYTHLSGLQFKVSAIRSERSQAEHQHLLIQQEIQQPFDPATPRLQQR